MKATWFVNGGIEMYFDSEISEYLTDSYMVVSKVRAIQ